MMLAPLRDNPRRQAVVRSATVPAPVEGWDASTALAAMKPLRAVQLKNWFPQPGYIEMRRGFDQHATGMGASTSIESLFAWEGPATSKMFAAGGSVIYDVTSAQPGTSSVTGLTNARWQSVNFTTSAGAFVFIVNGADAERYYDGSSWTSPTITGSGFSAGDAIHLNVHKKRIWLIKKNSTKAYYLATEAVAGTATPFELGSNFSAGGHLMAMATWSVDAGSGPDDLACFISSKGQIAVYQGTDPASALTWELVGVFNLAPPIGRRCFVQYGTSPLLLTVSGVLQLSLSLKTDTAQLTASAISARILRAMNDAARNYKDNYGWELSVYPHGTRLIVNIPTDENSTAVQYVMNTLTGAWCEQDSHNANCLLVYSGNLYFGGNDGRVYKADTGSADYTTPITAVGQTAYQALFTAGNIKRFTMVEPLVTAEGTARPSVGISTDFNETSVLSTPSSAAAAASSLWDVAVWDVDVWGGSSATVVSDWTSTSALGRFASVKFQATTGSDVSIGVWGSSKWAQGIWGRTGGAEQTMQINGFIALAEVGGPL